MRYGKIQSVLWKSVTFIRYDELTGFPFGATIGITVMQNRVILFTLEIFVTALNKTMLKNTLLYNRMPQEWVTRESWGFPPLLPPSHAFFLPLSSGEICVWWEFVDLLRRRRLFEWQLGKLDFTFLSPLTSRLWVERLRIKFILWLRLQHMLRYWLVFKWPFFCCMKLLFLFSVLLQLPLLR